METQADLSFASPRRRNRRAASLVATACVAFDLFAIAFVDPPARALLSWLPVVIGACAAAFVFRQAWLALVPATFALLLLAASQTAAGVQMANVSLATSLVFLARSHAFDASPAALPATFLAACSGWSCAAGLTTWLATRSRPGPWLAPLLLLGLSAGLGIGAIARLRNGDGKERPGRDYWRGFATYVAVFLLLAVVAVLAQLPMAGANSGSAAPGAWPENR